MNQPDRERVPRIANENCRLTLDQLARATAALDAWYDDGTVWSRRPGRVYDQRELVGMHAALEAPGIDAALEAFPGAPGDATMTTPEQDAWNRESMTQLRRLLSREPGNNASATAGAQTAPAPAQATVRDATTSGVPDTASTATPYGRRAAEPAEDAHGPVFGEETWAQLGIDYLVTDRPASPEQLSFPRRMTLSMPRKALPGSPPALSRQLGLNENLRILRSQ